jgi:hypothetical protein
MYLGISGGLFDQMRADNLIEPARVIGGRKLWDVRDLDMAFEALPREDGLTIGRPRKGKSVTGPTALTWKNA